MLTGTANARTNTEIKYSIVKNQERNASHTEKQFRSVSFDMR